MVRGLRLTQLLFPAGTTLVTDSKEELFRLTSVFGSVCKTRKLRVNMVLG